MSKNKNGLRNRIRATWGFWKASKSAAFTVVGEQADLVICLKQQEGGMVGFSMVYDASHVDEANNTYSPALGFGLDAKLLFASPRRREISQELVAAAVALQGDGAGVDTSDDTFSPIPTKKCLH